MAIFWYNGTNRLVMEVVIYSIIIFITIIVPKMVVMSLIII